MSPHFSRQKNSKPLEQFFAEFVFDKKREASHVSRNIIHRRAQMQKVPADDIVLATQKMQHAQSDYLKKCKCRPGTRRGLQRSKNVTSTGLADTCALSEKRLVICEDALAWIGVARLLLQNFCVEYVAHPALFVAPIATEEQ